MSKKEFKEVDKDTNDLIKEVILKEFSELKNAGIMGMFFNKKKTSRGRMVAAYIRTAKEIEKYLQNKLNGDELDYIIFIDENLFKDIEKEDKIRIIRHELMHTYVDFDKKQPYRLVSHDFDGFYEEIRIENQPGGDPKWKERIFTCLDSIYSKEDE